MLLIFVTSATPTKCAASAIQKILVPHETLTFTSLTSANLKRLALEVFLSKRVIFKHCHQMAAWPNGKALDYD
jgi:hypothetical protein